MVRSFLVGALAATLAALAVLPTGACRKADRRARCERVMTSSVGLVTAVAVGVGEALSDGEADLSCPKAHAGDPAACMEPEKAAEFRRRVAEGVETCLGWPDDLVTCLERMDVESPGCAEAYRRFRGVVDSTPRAEGPAPLWTASLPEEPNGCAALGGTLVCARDDALVGLRDGAVAWTKELAGVSGWLVPLAAGCVLAVHDAGVSCLAPADGAVRWQADPLPDGAHVDTATATANGAVVLDRDGRRHVFDAARCAAGPEGCRTSDRELRRFPDEPYLAVLGEGGFAVTAGPTLAVYDAAGRRRVALRAKEWASEAAGAGDTLWVGWDRSVGRLDLAACPAPAAAREGGSDDDGDAVEPEAAALPGPCGTVVATFDEAVTGHAPIPLGPDRVALTTDHLVAVAGRDPWKAEVDVVDRLYTGDGVLYALCEGDGRTPEVRALSVADGHTVWRTRLPSLPRVGVLDGPSLHADAATLYVTYEAQAVALPRR